MIASRPFPSPWAPRRLATATAQVGALAFVCLALTRLLQEVGGHSDQVDLVSYITGSQRLLSSDALYPAWQIRHPYMLWEASGGDGYVYPPTGALVLSPLLLGAPAWFLWVVGGLVAYVAVGLLIVRSEGANGLTPALLAAAYLISHPGLHSAKSGQASPWIAAAIGAMWLVRQPGYLAVAAGLVKATPGIGILWAVRRGEDLRLPILVAVLVVLATIPFGISNWLMWPAALANGEPDCQRWWSLWSFGCAGIPWAGWLIAGVLFVVLAQDPK